MILNKLKKSRKKGFSLIELVVVIAILAVLAALLAPALIHYVEDSRATSDTQSMDEVVNAVQIGLTNPDAYDEIASASISGNVSCYIDSNSESGRQKEVTKVGDDGTAQYTFGDDDRLLDEVPYTAAGNMRGVTITFVPNSAGELTYDLKDAVINKHVGGTAKLSEYQTLYNSVRQTVGDTITLDSNTYGNSEYTIFIRIGTTGGNQESAQDAIQVYGQYNGTNLPQTYTSGGTAIDRDESYTPPITQTPSNNDNNNTGTGTGNSTPSTPNGGSTTGSGTTSGTTTQKNLIPAGATYYVASSGETLEAGDEFPLSTKENDEYRFGQYKYQYCVYDESIYNGWNVELNTDVIDKNQTSYDPILDYINNKPVTSMLYTFYNCNNLTDVSGYKVPSTIKILEATFGSCENLTKTPNFSHCTQLLSMDSTFTGCPKIKSISAIPSTVKYIDYILDDCDSLETAPVIPSGVLTMNGAFAHCPNLKTAPVIPANVVEMAGLFRECTALTGTIQINTTKLEYFEECFKDTEQDIVLNGSCNLLNELAATATNSNVAVQ